MAIASAAPSVGSVPAHNSSNKTRECESTFLRNDTIKSKEHHLQNTMYSRNLSALAFAAEIPGVPFALSLNQEKSCHIGFCF